MATMETKAFQNYIDGRWVDASSGETFESYNPATGEVIGVFPKSGQDDVDQAVEAAKEAYESWRLVPAPKRAEILFRVGQRFIDRKDELTELMVQEMGKVRAEAGGDVQEAIDMTYYMAGEGRRLFGQTTPSEMPEKFQMSVRMPIGVVGAITPWNFPIAIPSWKIAPALVCGDTVVFKPATDTPLLCERFVEIFEEAGLPPGVLNIVHGGGGTVGERLVKHPDVPLISLTGSREVGIDVTRNAAPELKHVHLELGGKNAIIVMDDADVDLAVDGIVWSAFGTSGQRCTAASRVIAGGKVYGELQSKLVGRAEKLRLGNGLDEDVDDGSHPGNRRRRGDPDRERDRVRPLVVHLHARREQGVPRDARPERWDHVHQRENDRRRGAPPVWRDQADGERAPGGGAGRARLLHRVEGDLRRLLGQAPARADRLTDQPNGPGPRMARAVRTARATIMSIQGRREARARSPRSPSRAHRRRPGQRPGGRERSRARTRPAPGVEARRAGRLRPPGRR